MKKILFVSVSVLTACSYGVNGSTSEIADINNRCLSKNAWDSIISIHSVDKIRDSTFLKALHNFKNEPFPVSLIYLSQEPKEIIGVTYSSVRYVFNPKIDSNMILDGHSAILKEAEKNRIRNRVQKLLMEYQCEAGKKEALEQMNY